MNKIVVSSIIKNQVGQILTIRLNKEKPEGIVVPPGGKLEGNESIHECVIRENKEELGIIIKPIKIIGIFEKLFEDGIWTFIYVESELIDKNPSIMEPDKILSIEWKNIDEIENYKEISWYNLINNS